MTNNGQAEAVTRRQRETMRDDARRYARTAAARDGAPWSAWEGLQNSGRWATFACTGTMEPTDAVGPRLLGVYYPDGTCYRCGAPLEGRPAIQLCISCDHAAGDADDAAR
jgi:hypothetical protein